MSKRGCVVASVIQDNIKKHTQKNVGQTVGEKIVVAFQGKLITIQKEE